MSGLADEEARAIAFRQSLAFQQSFQSAREAALTGDAGARLRLGEAWEAWANRLEDPDYHVRP